MTLPKTALLTALLSLVSFFAHASHLCTFEIPSKQEISLEGDKASVRTLECKLGKDPSRENYLVNIVSSSKANIVNNLILPEGTIISMSFAPTQENQLNFALGLNAKLNIMNDSLDTLRLECVQL